MCDIIHGDIKCDNALVFPKSANGMAENWQVKISDFSHSIVSPTNSDNVSLKREAILGTDFYSPPEFDTPEIKHPERLKSADIWCFGVLLWEVMLDGTELLDSEKNVIDESMMRSLRKSGTLVDLAREQIDQYLQNQHLGESGLVEATLSLIEKCLQKEPSQRNDAISLLEDMQSSMTLRARYASLQSVPEPANLASLDYLPLFNLSDHYYEVGGTLTVAKQVFKALEVLTQSKSRLRLNAEFQMALCYASGFGVETDYRKAIDLVFKSAQEGLWSARMLLPRISAALGVSSDDPSASDSLKDWLIQAAKTGCLTANMDLATLYPGSDFISYAEEPIDSIERIPELLSATQKGQLPRVREVLCSVADANIRGEFGETALHYAVILPSSLGESIANILLSAEADILVPTSHTFTLARPQFALNPIEKGTTPFHLALGYDNLALIKVFVAHSGGLSDPRYWESSQHILAYAAQHQSVQCLEFLLHDPSTSSITKEHLNFFNDFGLSTMYYACRPDVLFRLQRFALHSPAHIEDSAESSPLSLRECHVIDLLRRAGCQIKVHCDDSFTAVHLLASYADSVVLDRFLQYPESNALKEVKSEHGWKPLKDAIVRGRITSFEVLLRHEADIRDVWDLNGSHALHCCGHYPGSLAVEMAKSLLQMDSTCIHTKELHGGFTPLHTAAVHGQVQLIEFYVARKAAVHILDSTHHTPLGQAVANREVAAVRVLCAAHRRQSLPLTALFKYKGSLVWDTQFPVNAMEQLLTPGLHYSTEGMFKSPLSDFGVCDHPFSEASRTILEFLLDSYPSPTRFGLNSFHNTMYTPLKLTGIFSAISMGNLAAVRAILERIKRKDEEESGTDRGCRHRSAQLQSLLRFALDFRYLKRDYVGDKNVRLNMVDYLQSECNVVFERTRARRVESRLPWRIYWRLFYRMYGDLEHRQLGRIGEWQISHRLPIPQTPEFGNFHWFKPSSGSWTFALLCAIWIPTLTCLIILATEPSARWSSRNLCQTLISFLLVL